MKTNNGDSMSNCRGINESFPDYRARLRRINGAIKASLRGTFAHVASEARTLPLEFIDAAVDADILSRQLRDVSVITLKSGVQFRVGRTRGVTYEPKLSKPKRPGAARRARLAAERV